MSAGCLHRWSTTADHKHICGRPDGHKGRHICAVCKETK